MNAAAGGGGHDGHPNRAAAFARAQLQHAQNQGHLGQGFHVANTNQNVIGQWHQLSGALGQHGGHGQVMDVINRLRAGTQQGHGAGNNWDAALGANQGADPNANGNDAFYGADPGVIQQIIAALSGGGQQQQPWQAPNAGAYMGAYGGGMQSSPSIGY